MPSLYHHRRAPQLDPAVFRSPGSEFRGCPFWSWNEKLDRARLLRQVPMFQEMGIGGYTVHCRTGLGTPFMGEEFLDHVEACVEAGEQRGMLTWLYDEDRWPSGFAGGLVTADPRFRSRWLTITRTPYVRGERSVQQTISQASSARTGNGRLVARWAVTRQADGRIGAYRRLATEAAPNETTAPGEERWYGYLEVAEPSTWYNHLTYVDTLNPAAIRRFTEVVHDRFHARLGARFGKSIPAIFTDEPQLAWSKRPQCGSDGLDCTLPWTDDFPDSHVAAFGSDPLDSLPEVLWERADGVASLARWRFHDHMAERFASAYADVLGDWCQAHGIASTGHLMQEPGLGDQTLSLGEAMRHYRGFQIPGIDILGDSREWEYRTALQCRSAKHQDGREAMLSELYGVTDWDFPFAGHKSQGDWQAALGVTVRVHHLSWVSMKGEAKRDYPASIFYQSPWWREYGCVEDHFARLNAALTRGRPGVRVAVVHPVESYWLAEGPRQDTQDLRGAQEERWRSLCAWLLHGLIDIDLICESRLPTQCPHGGAPLQVGAMAYDAIVVPALTTIRSSTLDRLEAFAAAGGRLIFLGEAPALVDVVPSDRAQRLAARCLRIANDRAAVLAALEPLRDVEVIAGNARTEQVLQHQRIDGDQRYVFICNPERQRGYPGAVIRLRGAWEVERLDTSSGDITAVAVTREGGWTLLRSDLPAAGHELLRLSPLGSLGTVPAAVADPVWRESAVLDDPVPVSLDEPNALLLDRAEWRIGDGPWRPSQEILRLDNDLRQALGLPERSGNIAQPWSEDAPAPVLGQVTLRFQIDTEVAIDGARLALEDAHEAVIRIDGAQVTARPDGWWVDECLSTVALPALARGRHNLEITLPYTRCSGLEWCYLLGDFGVRLSGRHAVATAPVRQLAFGDWTTQGLPFYTGNVTYRCRIQGDGQRLRLATPHLGGALAAVAVDGTRAGRIALAPWRLELGPLVGGHDLAITVFGHRRNAFGCVHRTDKGGWIGPEAWRTAGDSWSDGYDLRPMGLLSGPRLEQVQRA
jgi:hypothetical protein